MGPVTIMAASMIARVLAPIVKEGWKILTISEKKAEQKRLNDREDDFKKKLYIQRESHAQRLEETRVLHKEDFENKLYLQEKSHEQRLQEAREQHKSAMDKWKEQVYYERCFPLRNPFDMMICEPISNDKTYFKDVIVPCRIISALKDSDHPYATTINGNLSSFLVNHYPANSIHSVVSEIGAWKNEIPSNDASINYLYTGLKKQPVMIFAPTLINDGRTIIFKVWSWGLGEDLNYPAGFEFGRLEMQPLYLQTVQEETVAMMQLANEMNYKPTEVYSTKLQHNISIIKKIKAKKLDGTFRGQMLSFLTDAPEIDQAVKQKMETKISGVFCCIAGMYADAYHLLEYKTLPKLPSLLPDNIPFVKFMIRDLKDYYYVLLETLEQIEGDNMLMANLYLEVADSFSKILSLREKQEIVKPFLDKSLKHFALTTDLKDKVKQISIESLKDEIIRNPKIYNNPYFKEYNAISKQVHIKELK